MRNEVDQWHGIGMRSGLNASEIRRWLEVAPRPCAGHSAPLSRVPVHSGCNQLVVLGEQRRCGQPKGDPSLGAEGSQRAETDLHVRSHGERHMRSYADTGWRSGILRR